MDILERLKEQSEQCAFEDEHEVMIDAMQEIERLSKELYHIQDALVTGTNDQTPMSKAICGWINDCMAKDEEIEALRNEREWLKGIISDAIKEIEHPLNETEKQETLLRLYGAIDESTLDMFG